MTNFTSRKFLWVLFVIISLTLLIGYALGDQHSDISDPGLKGLTLLQHFRIHYITGIFFGFIILLSFFYIKRKRANEPLILLVTILWSHWPDIRFIYRQLPHDSWEIIFFFHTMIDEVHILFWILLLASIVLFISYNKMVKV